MEVQAVTIGQPAHVLGHDATLFEVF